MFIYDAVIGIIFKLFFIFAFLTDTEESFLDVIFFFFNRKRSKCLPLKLKDKSK